MKNTMFKRIAMVLAVVALVSGSAFNRENIKVEAEETNVQMMEISCPHCHETITVDVMKDDAPCGHCHENIHIDG
ncbi:hypothetical protein SAMN04487770_11966 [Butyrivibrio sp. ob235]|uniref:hypothetical protein n=1 Tax=Butyrivibrio sp. ob235 TaxID=1761780 RepID=UPI0008AC31BD|nr:hypothetical protein [Butyrivibrio sp. ob235]SEL86715.1 hypothetical protein SAMN04487770_11966 [Butyrivibrio sp. ob235]